jgi:hypothetical protein
VWKRPHATPKMQRPGLHPEAGPPPPPLLLGSGPFWQPPPAVQRQRLARWRRLQSMPFVLTRKVLLLRLHATDNSEQHLIWGLPAHALNRLGCQTDYGFTCQPRKAAAVPRCCIAARHLAHVRRLYARVCAVQCQLSNGCAK